MGTPATESIAHQSKEVARITAFSDGVFAIAMTPLTLQLEIPKRGDRGQSLIDLEPNFLAFVISFLLIGSYWMAHHRLFAVVVRYDSRLIWLNLLALFFIVLVPFATSLIAEYGDQPLAVIVCASTLAAAGLANTALAAYALVGSACAHPSLRRLWSATAFGEAPWLRPGPGSGAARRRREERRAGLVRIASLGGASGS